MNCLGRHCADSTVQVCHVERIQMVIGRDLNCLKPPHCACLPQAGSRKRCHMVIAEIQN